MKLQSIAAFIFFVFSLVSSDVSAQKSVAIGGDTISGFETRTCGWMLINYYREEAKNRQQFRDTGGTMNCSREDVTKREVPPLPLSPRPTLMEIAAYNGRLLAIQHKLSSKVDECWRRKLEYLQKEQELFEDLVAAMSVRIALYDIQFLYPDPVGRTLLSSACVLGGKNNKFTGRRVPATQTDSAFIRNHSISCVAKNKIEVRESDYQKTIVNKFGKYEVPKERSDVNYTLPDQIKSIYGRNITAFEDRQTCQQIVNKQADLNELNRIKPPPRREVIEEVEGQKKPSECVQFRNTFKCDKLEEGKEVKILMGWPSCIQEIIYEKCEKDLMNGKGGRERPELQRDNTAGGGQI